MLADRILPTTALSPLDITHLCSQYLQAQFRSELLKRCFSSQLGSIAMAPNPAPPLLLTVPLIMELDGISTMLADAFLNRGEQARLDICF